jgi:7-cyano-7-deazaguanine synthase
MIDTKSKKAVVLLSGGLDSTTVLAIAKSEDYEVYALSFSYGQRHSWELEAADRVARSFGVAQHRTATIDLRAFGGSALTDDIGVLKGRAVDEMSHGIPITYVPARNTIFLSFALPKQCVIRRSCHHSPQFQ